MTMLEHTLQLLFTALLLAPLSWNLNIHSKLKNMHERSVMFWDNFTKLSPK